MLTTELILTMLPPSGPKYFAASWDGEDQAEHVEIEQLVEVLFRDALDRGKLVNPRVVDQDVEPAECLVRLGEETTNIGLFRDVGLDRDGPAAVFENLGNDSVSSVLARGVIDDDGCALGRQMLGDRCADSLGCARNDRDLVLKFAHDLSPLLAFEGFCWHLLYRSVFNVGARQSMSRGIMYR